MDHRSPEFRFFAFLATNALIILAAFAGFSLYERLILGECRLAIGRPPLFAAYYNARLVLSLLLSLLLVAGLYRLRDSRAAIQRAELTPAKRMAAYAMLLAASVSTVLFVVDPVLFYELALEDKAVEWASALLPIACSFVFVYAFVRVLRSDRHDPRRSAALGLTALLALTLFVIGMEEISWMQRVFGIETPTAFAGNQQQEMNLHNMHSIGFGNTHKVAMLACLIVLPFLAQTAPANRLFDWVGDFLPSRFVLAISATWTGYDYGSWNLFLTPLIPLITLAVLACYARAAWVRRDRDELTLFALLAVFVAVAQITYLALGEQFVRGWDASEYAELIMAIGLAVFTWETTARLVARYGRAQGPFRAIPA